MNKKEVGECIGLWLAEGDNKTKQEITFTNNQPELIKIFDKTLSNLFNTSNKRLYIYSPNLTKVQSLIPNCRIKQYIDKRATKPYFIWRVWSTKVFQEWKELVERLSNDENCYEHILRGFFAGEGNIKEASHCSRVIRLTQSKRILCIEKALSFFNIEYNFSTYHREGYVIRRKENFDKLAKIKIADLHPLKKVKFNNMLKKYKQVHYKKNYLKKEIHTIVKKEKFYTTKNLASVFNRSKDRISETLTELKKEGIVENFKVGSKNYWTLKNKKVILISGLKYKYLNILKNDSKRTKDVAEKAGVCFRSAMNRLKELNKLGLVKRNKNKTWTIVPTNKEIIVL